MTCKIDDLSGPVITESCTFARGKSLWTSLKNGLNIFFSLRRSWLFLCYQSVYFWFTSRCTPESLIMCLPSFVDLQPIVHVPRLILRWSDCAWYSKLFYTHQWFFCIVNPVCKPATLVDKLFKWLDILVYDFHNCSALKFAGKCTS